MYMYSRVIRSSLSLCPDVDATDAYFDLASLGFSNLSTYNSSRKLSRSLQAKELWCVLHLPGSHR